MKLSVTSIQRGCVYDGPGVRTTVFLKGCSLHCPWCCNPETLSPGVDYFIDESKCLFKKGINSALCSNCERNGGKEPVNNCPFGVCEKTSQDYEVEELFTVLIKDKEQYNNGGGITFSGGEPLLQAYALRPLLEQIKKESIHVAFETTLVVPFDNFNYVKDYIDLFIVDLKLQKESVLPPKYYEQIKERLNVIRSNRADILYRLVVVPTMEEYLSDVISVINSLGISNIELLRCHNLGAAKYRRLNFRCNDYTCPSPVFDSICNSIHLGGLSVDKLTI